MKKIKFLFIAMFLICLTLTACQDSKMGKYWLLSGGEIEGQKVDDDYLKQAFPDGNIYFLSFEDNSEFKGVITGPIKGKWEATDKEVKVTSGQDSLEFVKEGNKLVLDNKEEKIRLEYTTTKEKPKLYDQFDEMISELDAQKEEFTPDVSLEETQDMSNAMNLAMFLVPEPKLIIGGGLNKAGEFVLLRYDYPDSDYKNADKVTLLDDVKATRLIKDEDYIYYVAQKGNDRSIKRVKIDALSPAEVLVKKAGNTEYLQKYNNRFYYKDENNHIVSVDADFKNPKTVIEDADAYYCYIVDGWMIYQDDKDKERIHARNIANGIDIRLTESAGFCPTIVGDYLYFTSYADPVKKSDEFNLCRVNLKDYKMQGDIQVFSLKEERSKDKKISDFMIHAYEKPIYISGGNDSSYSIEYWNEAKENMDKKGITVYCSIPERLRIEINFGKGDTISYINVFNSKNNGHRLAIYEK